MFKPEETAWVFEFILLYMCICIKVLRCQRYFNIIQQHCEDLKQEKSDVTLTFQVCKCKAYERHFKKQSYNVTLLKIIKQMTRLFCWSHQFPVKPVTLYSQLCLTNTSHWAIYSVSKELKSSFESATVNGCISQWITTSENWLII